MTDIDPSLTRLEARALDEADELRAEVEQWRATYGEDALRNAQRILDDRDRYARTAADLLRQRDEAKAELERTTTALTEARTHLAARNDEVGRLVAENARVRQDRDTKADIAKTNARVVATLTEIIERVEKFATETGGDYAQRLREVLHAPTSNEAGVAR